MSDISEIDGKGTMIATSDAASMLRRVIKPNCRQYEAIVIRGNNALVDEWKKEVLDKIAVNGCVDASIVYDCWTHFHEGKAICQMTELLAKNYLTVPDLAQAEYWATTLQHSSVEELHAMGSAAIAMGWMICQNYIKFWYAQEKWKRIYSLSDSPLAWEKERGKHYGLLRGEEFALWTKEVQQDVGDKVKTILSIHVQPEGLAGRP